MADVDEEYSKDNNYKVIIAIRSEYLADEE